MPASTADLAHRPGVELVNAGSWQLLSGSWNPNRKDILAAVEAAQCPAVRRPRLKLGHLDPRFNAADSAEHDGTPSLGWFDNLRASDDGNTLIGDQVALPWLNAVQAAAYPDRSVEGTHNARCALGHVHPFVVTAVSLLGETPPGIPTLRSIKSIDDLPAALGVSASGEDLKDGESVQATVRAAAEPDDSEGDEPVHTGAMVALMVAAEDAARLAVEGGESADELHLTLAYLGEAAELGVTGQQDIIDVVSTAVNGMPTVDATAFAVTAFNPGTKAEADTCLVYGVTGDFLDTVHDFVMQSIAESSAGTRVPPQILPWVAHVTAVYTDDLGRLSDLAVNLGPLRFDRVRLAFAGQYTDIPLIDWDEEPDDPSRVVEDSGLVAAAASGGAELKKYWLSGPGLAKWADKPHPWTALYKALRKYIKDPDEAKRTASQWYRLHFGRMPNQGVKASEASPTPDLPAAEPEQVIQPEEDPVSLSDDMRSRLGLDAEADEAAALAAIDVLKAKADTPAPAEPTAEMVAASAAATEKAEKAQSALELMKEELARQSSELATIKASAANTVKASFFGGLVTAGKLKPADRETWEARYDRDPQMVSEILGARADGSEVPIMASGTVGSAEPDGAEDTDAEFDREFAGLFSPKAG